MLIYCRRAIVLGSTSWMLQTMIQTCLCMSVHGKLLSFATNQTRIWSLRFKNLRFKNTILPFGRITGLAKAVDHTRYWAKGRCQVSSVEVLLSAHWSFLKPFSYSLLYSKIPELLCNAYWELFFYFFPFLSLLLWTYLLLIGFQMRLSYLKQVFFCGYLLRCPCKYFSKSHLALSNMGGWT